MDSSNEMDGKEDALLDEIKRSGPSLQTKQTIMTDEGMTMMAEGLKRSRQENDMSQSPIVREVLKHLGTNRTVLDIGAGVGRFTIPLAEAGCLVTALEPSSTMRAHLDDALQEKSVTEAVTVIPNQWPHAFENRFDIVLAAYVVHFSADPALFITAMQDAAIERCILAVHVDSMMGPLAELWPLFHPDQEPPHMMVFSDLYPLMLEAGIVADVSVIEQGAPRFTDPPSATSMLARRLAIQDDPQALEQLTTWVTKHWDRVTGRRRRSAIISWRPDPVK